jgi:transcriptional regulator GlxA family with amidase domain
MRCQDRESVNGYLGPSAEVLDLLHAAHRRGIRIAAISSGGSRVLAASGLLEGRRAATHRSRAHAIAERYRCGYGGLGQHGDLLIERAAP